MDFRLLNSRLINPVGNVLSFENMYFYWRVALKHFGNRSLLLIRKEAPFYPLLADILYCFGASSTLYVLGEDYEVLGKDARAASLAVIYSGLNKSH